MKIIKSLSNNKQLRWFLDFCRYALSTPPGIMLLLCVVGVSTPIAKNLKNKLRCYCWIGSKRKAVPVNGRKRPSTRPGAVAGCLISILIFILSACSGGTTRLKLEEEEIQSVNLALNTPIPTDSPEFETEYELKIRARGVTLGKYEPEYGCYLGAYILDDKIVDKKIDNFERAVGVEHAFYTYSMVSGGEFLEKWFLECVAKMKTPSVTISPPSKTDPYNISLITKTAKELGAYSLPVFVHLYPYSKSMGFTAKEYIDFYKSAKAVFAEHAPNAALVWDVYFEDVYDCAAFYPGDEYADWVGISIYLNVSQSGEYKDALSYLRYFYYSYQKIKPIMVSELAVSHFTTENNSYYTEQAAAEIERLYGAIGKSFPRVKAVAYMGFNFTEMASGKNLHDYSITSEDMLKQSYNKAASGSSFLPSVTESVINPCIMLKSPFPAYYKNGAYYVAHKTLEFDMELRDLHLLAPKAVLILGEKYYSMGDINGYKAIDFFVDNEDNVIVIDFR